MIQIRKYIKILPLIILLSMTCGQSDAKSNATLPILYNDGKLHTLIFTDNQDQETSNYYYALLLIKHDYPTQDVDINIYNKQTTLTPAMINHWHLKTFPSLILIKENKILLKLEGHQSWETIYNEMNTTFATITK